MTIRVVSLNCWGGRVPQPLLQFIKEIDADVYCLQEIYSAPRCVPMELIFKERDAEMPVRPQLFREISELLPEHQAFFCPAAQGYLHDGASFEQYPNIRYGIATFVREAYPVVEQQAAFVFGGYRAHAWGEPPLPRPAHCVRIFDYASDDSLVVAHMHGLWHKSGKTDTDERTVQADTLKIVLEEMCEPDEERVIICGDFNVLPDSYTLAVFKELGMRELVTNSGFISTRTSYYTRDPHYADYMLVSPQVRVSKFDVPAQPEVSDHRPLVLECE